MAVEHSVARALDEHVSDKKWALAWALRDREDVIGCLEYDSSGLSSFDEGELYKDMELQALVSSAAMSLLFWRSFAQQLYLDVEAQEAITISLMQHFNQAKCC